MSNTHTKKPLSTSLLHFEFSVVKKWLNFLKHGTVRKIQVSEGKKTPARVIYEYISTLDSDILLFNNY